MPNDAAGFFLLGRIHQLSNRHTTAIAYYSSALQLDPMLWGAYEELCALGADHEAQQYLASGGGGGGGVPARPGPSHAAAGADAAAGPPSPTSFQLVATPAAAPPQQHGSAVSPSASTAATSGGLAGMFGWMDSGRQRGGGGGPPATGGSYDGDITPSTAFYATPSPGGHASAAPPPAPRGGGGAGPRPAWPATTSPAPLLVTTGGGLGLPSGPPGPQRKFMDEGKLRKVSGKLFADPASVLKTLRWQGDACGGDASGGGSLADMAALPGLPRGQRSAEGQAQALPLLQALGEGYRLLCMYRWVRSTAGGRKAASARWLAGKLAARRRVAPPHRLRLPARRLPLPNLSLLHLAPRRCQEAIAAFGRLPPHHYQTGWVLCCVGRACFEMVDYPEAAKAFSWARQVRESTGAGGSQVAAVARCATGPLLWASPHAAASPCPPCSPHPPSCPPGGPVPPQGAGGVQHGAVALQARDGAGTAGADGVQPGPPLALRLVHAGQLPLPAEGGTVVRGCGAWVGEGRGGNGLQARRTPPCPDLTARPALPRHPSNHRSTRRRCATSSARCSWTPRFRTPTRWRVTSTLPTRTLKR